MRWNEYRAPDPWTKRKRAGFLWFPKKADGQWRWLERAAWEQEFDPYKGRYVLAHWEEDPQ